MRRSVFVAAAVLFLSAAALFAGGRPESIEYPVDYESARSLVVAYRGPIELTVDNRWVSSIGSGGYFYLKRRFLIQTVVIVGRAGEEGGPELKLWINNIRRRYPENHRLLVGDVLEEAAIGHGLGAVAAISRVYRDKGIDAAYDVIRRIRDQRVRASIIESFVLVHPLDGDDSLAAFQWALPPHYSRHRVRSHRAKQNRARSCAWQKREA